MSEYQQRASSFSANWWQALTLRERGTTTRDTGDIDLAQRRYQRWQEENPQLNEEVFAARLQAEGLTPTELTALLGESSTTLQQRQLEQLPWFTDLNAAYTNADMPAIFEDGAGFLVMAEPLLHWASQQLRQRLAVTLEEIDESIFTLEFAQQTLFRTLAEQIPPLLERTLVLEMHVARLQRLLTGNTPEARFAAFVERLRDHAVVLALLEEYPVLARQLITKVRYTVTAMAEILERIVRDWSQIEATFFPDNAPGTLIEVAIGEGDTHRQGRSVAILHFANGQRLVYKPRSLAVEQHFQELLTWLNQQGADPSFQTLTILDQGDYGWVEFVAAAPCATSAEIERFYQRQGGYLALLYVLNAADFHFENLIAAGEHPMLIDLEALFHPDVIEYNPDDPGQLAQQALDQSVLSIGMLPQRLQFHADAAAIDISGLGAAEEQLTPDKLPIWQGLGTDEMRLTRQHVAFRSEGHRPQLAGQTLDVHAQARAVADGFAHIYQLLLRQRSDFLAPNGPLARFANDELRVVARATRTYSLLLQESSHPDLLRNALDRDRFYTRLWQDLAAAPALARLLASERRDLHQGDVPIFLTKPTSPHLWDSDGQMIPDYLPETGMNRVQQRLSAMDKRDLARQLWYIDASFATIDGTNRHSMTTASEPQLSAKSVQPTTTDFLATACVIGDQLADLAHRHEDHAVWIGLGLDEQDNWSLAPLTMHLYDGHAGLALFFAYLGQATGQERYRQIAETALATTLTQAEALTATFPYVGGFNGWGGLIYTLTHLGKLWQRPALWEKATELAQLVPSYIEQDEQFDVIGGAAGCIGAVAALYRCTADPQLRTVIQQCADHLVENAQDMPTGIGWIVPNMGDQPLAGFSHGAAGIAWALLTAAELTNKEAYQQVATEALRYERSLFAPTAANWRDLRTQAATSTEESKESDQDAFMHAWCHGAPGIGLARLAMVSQLTDPLLQDEIETALQSTATAGFGGGHCLCHGDMGNLELFIKGAEALAQPALLDHARLVANTILEQQPGSGWLCGVPGGVETPGLMVGLAGIGYELLRLHEPTQIPSLLLMEGPRG